MKHTYSIHPTFFVAQGSGMIRSPFWVMRDKKQAKRDDPEKLAKLFSAAYKIFRMRIRELGNIDQETNQHDADALRVMLEGLIIAKKNIQK